MTIVYLALGTNVGDSTTNLDAAVTLLQEKITNLTEAPRYISKAVGYTDQPDFVNSAVRGETDLQPLELLSFVKNIEQQVGRIARFRWGPREIDIDIIFYGDHIIHEPTLDIPHPRFMERDFVLLPLCSLSPDLVDPLSNLTVSELYEKIPVDERSIQA